ncbi:TRAP transporter TatT component family protein [Alloalcanivorax marinus]|uniref:TRAP transporter TatT component family protein n=1 Tax=Alloalcanivorax marinus TaxID=1177169 RepID=UPI001EF832E4|nr:TRAP transporter TatT component family protein [Alloalcanivorax marinus]
MKQRTRALVAMVGLVLMLQGCGLARVGDSLGQGVRQNGDLATVEAGLPSYLLMIDGLIVNWPERQSLLLTGADLYGAYAGLFVDDEARAARLNARALDYALRAACVHQDDYCRARKMDVPAFESLLAEADTGDVPVLFTLGGAWAGYIQTHADDWNAVAELSRVRLLMERVVALDEDYQYGQAYMYLGVLNSLLPASLGGQPDAARDAFQRAIELSDGDNLLARVLYAEYYARLVFDRDLHDEQLRRVLDADVDVPDLTLQNAYAKREARRLLDSADEYF